MSGFFVALMPAIGAIHINEAPRDYEFRIVLTPTYLQTPPPGTGLESNAAITGRERITYGVPYLGGSFGFEAYIELIFSNITLLWTWTATITTPFGTGSASGSGLPGSVTVTWQFTNLYETVNSACDWELGFDALVVKVDAATVLTLGPTTQSGSGFDRREATNRQEPTAGFDGGALETELNPARHCSPTFADQPEPYYRAVAALISGWRFKDYGTGAWLTDSVVLDSIGGMETGCACFEGLQNWSAITSYSIANQSEWYDRTVKTDLGLIPCECPEGSTGDPSILDVWSVVREIRETSSYIKALPSTSGILTVERARYGMCWDGPLAVTETEDLTQTTGVTVSSGKRETVHQTYLTYCGELITLNPCSAIDHIVVGQEFGDDNCGDEFVSDSCLYNGWAETTWPNTIPCAPSTAWPWNFETDDGRFYRTDIREGDVWVFGSQFHTPPFSVQGQITSTGDCIRPTIAEDTRKRVHLTYTRVIAGAGSGYRRWSDDDGITFSAETAVGIANGWFTTVCPGEDGDIIIAAFVYDAGTSGPGKIKIQYQGSGDTALSSEITALDDTGTPLSVQATTFHISQAKHGAKAWLLSCLIDGETDTSEWQCWHEDTADSGAFSFKRKV